MSDPTPAKTRLMIGPWVTRLTADGVVYYRSSEERSIAGLQIRLRQRPLRPFKELVDAQVAGMSKYVGKIEVRSVEQILTEEGEYGAFTAITGVGIADNKPVLCVLAVVLGDEWFDRFDGWMTDAAGFDHYLVLARDAVTKHILALGQGRARRFYYTPPAGWQALQRDLLVQWFPLDYPKHCAVITVPPTFPGTVQPSPSIETILGRRFLSFEKSREPALETVMFNGLGGVFRHDVGHYTAEGPRTTHMITAALLDREQVMTYIVRLETTDEYLDEDRNKLFQICQSLRPIPARSAPSKTVDNALQTMWSEL